MIYPICEVRGVCKVVSVRHRLVTAVAGVADGTIAGTVGEPFGSSAKSQTSGQPVSVLD
jgi:hypothetical protein